MVVIQKYGILYVPDFLNNRMGIVNCADEHTGTLEDDPKLSLHLGIIFIIPTLFDVLQNFRLNHFLAAFFPSFLASFLSYYGSGGGGGNLKTYLPTSITSFKPNIRLSMQGCLRAS